jgi:hypothetical protein
MFTFNACSSDDSEIDLEMFSEVIPLDFVRLSRQPDDVPSPEPADEVPTIVIPEEPPAALTDDVLPEEPSTVEIVKDVIPEEPVVDVPPTLTGSSEKTLFEALEESFMVDDIEKYIDGVYITQQSPYIAMKGHPTEQFIAFSNGVVRN